MTHRLVPCQTRALRGVEARWRRDAKRFLHACKGTQTSVSRREQLQRRGNADLRTEQQLLGCPIWRSEAGACSGASCRASEEPRTRPDRLLGLARLRRGLDHGSSAAFRCNEAGRSMVKGVTTAIVLFESVHNSKHVGKVVDIHSSCESSIGFAASDGTTRNVARHQPRRTCCINGQARPS